MSCSINDVHNLVSAECTLYR